MQDIRIGQEEFLCSQRLLKELREMGLYQGYLNIRLVHMKNEFENIISSNILDDQNTDEKELKNKVISFLSGYLPYPNMIEL
jgi:hypothetical protein